MISLAIVGIAVGGVVLKLGIPAGAAFSLAFLIVGGGLLTLQFVTNRGNPVFGCAILALGACMGGGWTAMELTDAGLPEWASLVAVVLLGVGLLAGLGLVAGRGGAARVGNERRKLAERRGWQYAAEGNVPVPGPRSAAIFAATNGTAAATHVVTATVNGVPVTMGDLARPAAKGTRVQSVWLVSLPSAVPYTVLATFQTADRRHASVPPTDDPRFAGLLLTPRVREAASALKRTVWAENAYLCAHWDGGARTGVSATAAEQSIDKLTALAAQLPWENLTR